LRTSLSLVEQALLGTISCLGAGLAACSTNASAPAAVHEGAPPPAPSSEVVLARILDLGEHDNRVQAQLKTLCKTIGPRLTGTERFDQAARWAVEQFQSF